MLGAEPEPWRSREEEQSETNQKEEQEVLQFQADLSSSSREDDGQAVFGGNVFEGACPAAPQLRQEFRTGERQTWKRTDLYSC